MTTERLIARIAAADPLAGAGDVAGGPFGEALLAAVTATDPRVAEAAARPARRAAPRVAVAVAVLLALLAGGAYAAYELLRPSRAAERALDGLTLPGPAGAEDVTPVDGSLRPLVQLMRDGTSRDLWSVRTRGGRTLFVLGEEPALGGVVLGCDPLPPAEAARLCGQAEDPAGRTVVGRLRDPAVTVRAVLAGGGVVDGAAGNGAFLVVVPRGAQLVRVEALDRAGGVIAELPVPETGRTP